jgi:hypothetical protein
MEQRRITDVDVSFADALRWCWRIWWAWLLASLPFTGSVALIILLTRVSVATGSNIGLAFAAATIAGILIGSVLFPDSFATGDSESESGAET